MVSECFFISGKEWEEKLVRKENRYQVQENVWKNVEYLTFPLLSEIDAVRHLFSTRAGGVSKGIYASMNLSYQRGDDPSCVDENFRRIAEVLETTPEHIVCAKQTHTTNIRKVTGLDGGKGVTRPVDYDHIDGLVTDEPGIVLCTSFADCVPLYFVDPVKKAIGLAHSGWRGTVAHMGACMVQRMKQEYGSNPKDILAVIGPSICVDCYEIGEDVAQQVRAAFSEEKILRQGKENGKYQLDLWEANRQVLLQEGILPEHLEITDVCTCCNSNLLFSHRASHGQRGNLCVFLELRKC